MMANRLEQLALQKQQEEMFEASLGMESGWDNDVQPYYEGPLATDMTSSISFAETLTASEILRDIQEDEDVTWQESCSSEDMVQRVILEALEADEEDGDMQYLLQMAKEHSVSAYHSQQGIEDGDEGDDEEAEGMRPAVLLTKTVNILTWL